MNIFEDYCNLHLDIDNVKFQINAVKLSIKLFLSFYKLFLILFSSAAKLIYSNYFHDLIIIIFINESFYIFQYSCIFKSSS